MQRPFARAARRRRLVNDHERYAATLAGFHIIAFAGYMLKQAADLMRRAWYPLGHVERRTCTANVHDNTGQAGRHLAAGPGHC